MPRPQVRVIGLKQVTRELKKYGDGAVSDLKQVHAATAKIVEDAARPKAPTSAGGSGPSGAYWQKPNHSPGLMRDTLRSTGTQRGGFVRAGKKLVPYAGPVHFGWPSRPNAAKRWRGGPIKPNPFIYDALDERRNEVEDAFMRYLDQVARKHLG